LYCGTRGAFASFLLSKGSCPKKEQKN